MVRLTKHQIDFVLDTTFDLQGRLRLGLWPLTSLCLRDR